MLIPSIIALILFLIMIRLLINIYVRYIYPIRQLSKPRNVSGYVMTRLGEYEHREIVKKLIKRNLQHWEEVHHINGTKWDNRKSNLALMSRENHIRWHQKLDWMWEKRMRPSIRWQRRNLKEVFQARLF